MKKYIDLSINIIYIFILNIVLSLLIFKSVTFLSIVFYIFESIAFGSLIYSVCNICKNYKISKFLNIIVLSFIFIHRNPNIRNNNQNQKKYKN